MLYECQVFLVHMWPTPGISYVNGSGQMLAQICISKCGPSMVKYGPHSPNLGQLFYAASGPMVLPHTNLGHCWPTCGIKELAQIWRIWAIFCHVWPTFANANLGQHLPRSVNIWHARCGPTMNQAHLPLLAHKRINKYGPVMAKCVLCLAKMCG